MKKFLTALFAIMLLSASIACAEIKTYTGSGEYLLTDENISFAKSRAEISAERNILDQVCVYVKAQSSIVDNEFDDDEVISICAGILHVTDTKIKMVDDANGILVKAVVTAEVDIDELETLLKQAIAERMKN
ncbi:MAG: hypothetical protein IKE46_08500 [Selenomonadaceae bacterium]|nr:hypothetical protein [Selenomonadaceae bacterium]